MPKNALRETISRLLREADDDKESGDATADDPQPSAVDPEKAVKKAEASFDLPIKKMLQKSLSEATSAKSEGLDLRRLTRRLFEEDEEDSLLGPDDSEDEAPAAGPTVPTKKSLESIDIGSYSEAVVRLIENFSNLIDVKTILVEMAKVELGETYDDSTVSAFTEFLSEEYDIEIGASKWDKEIENQPPPARGAGTSG